MRKAVYFRSWRRTVLARPSHEGDVLYRVWHGRSLAQTVTEFPKARQAIRIVQTLAIWQRCWRRGSYDVQVSLGSFVFFALRFVFFLFLLSCRQHFPLHFCHEFTLSLSLSLCSVHPYTAVTSSEVVALSISRHDLLLHIPPATITQLENLIKS